MKSLQPIKPLSDIKGGLTWLIQALNQPLALLTGAWRVAVGCNGVCYKYVAHKTARGSYYLEGFEYCATCQVFIRWKAIPCPCCHIKLRTKRKNAPDALARHAS